MYASQVVQVFSNLRRPETHFRHEQDHQRAIALTGSIIIIQNTIVTVYEVEYKKTVKRKLWKRAKWFSEVIKNKYSNTTLGRARLEDAKRWKVKLHCNAKAYQSILQNPMPKKDKHIWRTDQNMPQTIEKNWFRQKRITIEQIMQLSVHGDMKSTKEGIFQQKTP